MMNKKYIIISIISIILVVALGISLAYFTPNIIGNGANINVVSGIFDLDISDSNISPNIVFRPILDSTVDTSSYAYRNAFTVSRSEDSNLDGCYSLSLVVDSIGNNLKNEWFKYKITDGTVTYTGTLAGLSAGSSKSLIKNVYISKDTSTHNYTLTLWLSYSNTKDQSSILTGEESSRTFTGHIVANGHNGTCSSSKTLVDQILEQNNATNESTVPERSDFSVAYTGSTTFFKTNNTEDNSTVYYYAGNATNNWVKFGKYAVDSTQWVGYNSSGNSEVYNTESACTSSSYNTNCHKLYLAGDDMYWRIVRTNEEIEGGGVRLLYAGTSVDTKDGYIAKSAYNSVTNDSTYVGYMNGTTGITTAIDRSNTNPSTIKGVIDAWYTANIKTSGTTYNDYVNTKAIYCNDRSVNSSFNYATDYNQKHIPFASYERIGTDTTYGGANYNPSYACGVTKNGFGSYFTNESDANRKLDKFSADNTVGNGKLADAPVALITADEIAFAGGKASANNATAWYYLNAASTPSSATNNKMWWTMSPHWVQKDGNAVVTWSINGSAYAGRISSGIVANSAYVVRPVISIYSDILVTSGNGSAAQPYELGLAE